MMVLVEVTAACSALALSLGMDATLSYYCRMYLLSTLGTPLDVERTVTGEKR